MEDFPIMAQLPRTDAELIALAHDVLTGYRAHPEIFHNPPIDLDGVDSKLTDYAQVDHAWNVNQAEGVMLTAKRGGISAGLASDVQALLRHAETVVQDPAQLKLINWGGRAAPTPLQLPGQVQNLTDAKQGADWISLTWGAPADGGKPSTFIIQYRIMPDGDWAIADTTPDIKITLVGQPKGKTLEYRVFARNKAGDGLVSNVIEVVL
jgi:hypothetical protein